MLKHEIETFIEEMKRLLLFYFQIKSIMQPLLYNLTYSRGLIVS